MMSYDELVAALEHAWEVAGLHEHALVESVQPDAHERFYRAELFPEHPEPMTEENIPPWVEVTFSWSAAHQLRAEGRRVEAEPLYISWSYMLLVRNGMQTLTDAELVRRFQQAVYTAFRRFYPLDTEEMGAVAVEVRRLYQRDDQRIQQAYVQVMSANMTDLSEQWNTPDTLALSRLLRTEMQLESTIIQALSDAFAGDGNGGYRAVDTA